MIRTVILPNNWPRQTPRGERRVTKQKAGLVGVFLLTAFAGAASAAPDPRISPVVSAIRTQNIARTVRTLAAFGTRSTLSAQDNPRRGIGAARDWIFGQFAALQLASNGRLTVEKQTWTQPPGPRVSRPTVLTNIVATLRGTDSRAASRVYVVSGHYDSMPSDPTDGLSDAPGADDDASGVAAVLEMARAMTSRSYPATIVFLAVAGEEQGLLGSTHFAEDAKTRGMDIEAMFTNDIIGGARGGNGVKNRKIVRVFSEGVPSDETPAQAMLRRSVGGENDAPSRQLARYIKEVGEKNVPEFWVRLVARRDRYGRGGDHIPFLENGVAAVRFTEASEDFRHQHQNVRLENGVLLGDLPQFVDAGYAANVARVNAAALISLALAPPAPRRAALLTGRPSVDTNLRWDAVPGVVGYEVVWRETTAPLWTHARRVGNVLQVTLPGLSKDDFCFGVRAVSASGRRSPVSFPAPARR